MAQYTTNTFMSDGGGSYTGAAAGTAGATTAGGPYGAGNFDFSSSPALGELSSALSALNGHATDNTLSMVDGMSTGLSYAGHLADEIASRFNGVNNNIVTSWQNVSDFAYKIDQRVVTLTGNFTKQLKAFIETTQMHEQEIGQATTTANNLAAEILSSLGL